MEKRGIRTCAIALITAVLVATPALAGESLQERVADHEDRVDAHRREKASAALEEDLQHSIALIREYRRDLDALFVPEES